MSSSLIKLLFTQYNGIVTIVIVWGMGTRNGTGAWKYGALWNVIINDLSGHIRVIILDNINQLVVKIVWI